jgi:hypothetical protein
MKPIIIIAIVFGIIITVTGYIFYVAIEEQSRMEQQVKLNECASILGQFKLGFGSQIEEYNENVLSANDECMQEYNKKYSNLNDVKRIKADFDPQFSSHFGGLYCTQDEYGYVTMTGQFTNGDMYYSSIYFTLGITDHQDRIVATGTGTVNNISPYQTKIFDASASWDGNYKECIIEINFVVP